MTQERGRLSTEAEAMGERKGHGHGTDRQA